ncbi:GNAT family N-acetyltransferase [Paenibacillus sp. FSL K6-1096]|uniref:GNAT family N-acetyltransferase n=1 Tax=Paenibacillus sp. FSL K6-1096 TaxID=2921460 RepID=UPI0030EB3582
MITLVPMDEATFQSFLKQSTSDYAEEKVKAGTWAADTALTQAREEMNRYLPQGLHTEGAYFYSVVEQATGTQAGYLWINVTEKRGVREAFIYDIYIFEPFQGRGYGKQTLLLLDEEARKLKVAKIGLHVFGHNERAFGLYKKMGFQVTDITMSKTL